MSGGSKKSTLAPTPDTPDPNAGAASARQQFNAATQGRQGTVLASSLLKHKQGVDVTQPGQDTATTQATPDQQKKPKSFIGFAGGRYARY